MKKLLIKTSLFAVCFIFLLSACSQITLKASGTVEDISKPHNGECIVRIYGDKPGYYWRVRNCSPVPNIGDTETIIHDNDTGFYYLDR